MSVTAGAGVANLGGSSMSVHTQIGHPSTFGSVLGMHCEVLPPCMGFCLTMIRRYYLL